MNLLAPTKTIYPIRVLITPKVSELRRPESISSPKIKLAIICKSGPIINKTPGKIKNIALQILTPNFTCLFFNKIRDSKITEAQI